MSFDEYELLRWLHKCADEEQEKIFKNILYQRNKLLEFVKKVARIEDLTQHEAENDEDENINLARELLKEIGEA